MVCRYSGAVAYSGRWTPGTLTNYITKNYAEPRLLIVTDPRTDSQAITEAFYANIPVIALCDTDASLRYALALAARHTRASGTEWTVERLRHSMDTRDPEAP